MTGQLEEGGKINKNVRNICEHDKKSTESGTVEKGGSRKMLCDVNRDVKRNNK